MTEEEHDRLLAEQQIMSEAGFRARQAAEFKEQQARIPAGPGRPTHIPPSNFATIPLTPPDDPVYDFEHLGLRIAESLLLAAENQVTEAQNLFERTKVLAEGIRAQVKEHTELVTNLNGRLKTFGAQMLDAHRKFNGDKH